MKALDRMILGSLMPMQGNFVTVETALAVKDKVKLSSKDLEAIGLTIDEKNGRAVWDAEKDVDVPMDFSKGEKALIIKTLKELEQAQKLTGENIGLYREFVLKEESPNGDSK